MTDRITTTELRRGGHSYHTARCACGREAIASTGTKARMPNRTDAVRYATVVLLWTQAEGCRSCQKPVSVSWRAAQPRVAAALEADPDVTVCSFVESVARELAANDGSGFSDDLRSLDGNEEPFRLEAAQ